MIELGNDPEENIQIIGKAKRWRHWDSIIMEMQSIVDISEQYPIKNEEELAHIEKLITQLQSLK